MWTVELKSEVYGSETYEYDTLDEALAGIKRLTLKVLYCGNTFSEEETDEVRNPKVR